MSTGVIFSARIERGHARHSGRPSVFLPGCAHLAHKRSVERSRSLAYRAGCSHLLCRERNLMALLKGGQNELFADSPKKHNQASTLTVDVRSVAHHAHSNGLHQQADNAIHQEKGRRDHALPRLRSLALPLKLASRAQARVDLQKYLFESGAHHFFVSGAEEPELIDDVDMDSE
jgi:hypothetical protein